MNAPFQDFKQSKLIDVSLVNLLGLPTFPQICSISVDRTKIFRKIYFGGWQENTFSSLNYTGDFVAVMDGAEVLRFPFFRGISVPSNPNRFSLAFTPNANSAPEDGPNFTQLCFNQSISIELVPFNVAIACDEMHLEVNVVNTVSTGGTLDFLLACSSSSEKVVYG